MFIYRFVMWQGEYLQIDLGVVRQVRHIALQGRPGSSDYVKTFYLRYGNNGLDFNNYGENATVKYKVDNGFLLHGANIYKCFKSDSNEWENLGQYIVNWWLLVLSGERDTHLVSQVGNQ